MGYQIYKNGGLRRTFQDSLFVELVEVHNDEPIPQEIFIVRPVSAVTPSSVTENLRLEYHIMSGYVMVFSPPILSVTEDGLAAETGLAITFFLWN